MTTAIATTPTATTPTVTASGTTPTVAPEFRVRLSYLDNYGGGTPAAQYPGILAPLGSASNPGLMFPYSPSITNTQDVDYASMSMTHANTDYHAFNHTPNVTISIAGKFTIQNYQEGIYALACIHFLRSVSRMYFGETDASSGLAGIPPPILQLNGYGTYMYNKLRVYVKSHSFAYEENIDTVNINLANGNYVRLPVIFTLNVGLVVQNTPRAQRKDFSLDQFRSGAMMDTVAATTNSGWI